jgi:hypothetical protein
MKTNPVFVVNKTAVHNFSQGDSIRANIKTAVNAAEIKHEQRDGRDVIVVPSYTLPDNIVMNNIFYPAEEIEKSYQTLEGTPAPLGHPTVNDMFVPAASPLGLNLGYFGAWNSNVERRGNRVFVEKVIDVERANESDMGRRVIEAINEGKPIHTSTGLLMHMRECTNGLADWEGYDMEFDHDAILLDEEGAANPSQGVGMMVNDKKVAVVNSSIEQDFDQEVEWAVEQIVRAAERAEEREDTNPLVQRIKSAIMKAIGLERETETVEGNSEMTDVTKEQFDELSAKVNALAEVDHTETITSAVNDAMAPMNEFIASQKAAANAEHEALVAKAVEAELLSEDDAKATPMNALKALIEASTEEQPLPAPGIINGFNSNAEKISLASDWENE